MLKRLICSILLVIAAAAFVPLGTVEAADDGIVKFKSAYSMPETIARMKKDIADKGIKFFDEIDQAKLAADAGITLLPSTLLVFGNPPLGTLFITADPDAGLDWHAGARVSTRQGRRVGGLYRFRLDQEAPRYQESREGIQHGNGGHYFHHLDGEGEVALKATQRRRAGSGFHRPARRRRARRRFVRRYASS